MDNTLKQTQVIADIDSFNDLFLKYYSNIPTFIKVKNGDINVKVQFIEYVDHLVSFKMVGLDENNEEENYENCFVYSREGDNTIFTFLKIHKKNSDNIYRFRPLKIQIVRQPRKEQRKNTGPSNVLFVTNTISDFVLENSLSSAYKTLDRIKDKLIANLAKIFDEIKITFLGEFKYNIRMKFFLKENKQPIWISNLNEEPNEKQKRIHDVYINDIYPKDRALQAKNYLVSEISVPILYKMKIPFGFVQVNSRKPLLENALSTVKRMASIVEALLEKHGVFPKSNEQITVTDISKNGMGLSFERSRRNLVRYFKQDCLVHFDLILPENKKANILALVKNVSIVESKIVKVGCEIKDIDALSELHFDDYLESIGIDPYE